MSRLYKGGRPPKKRTERLNIVMTDTEYLTIQHCAEVMGVSMAAVVREGVTRVARHLKSQGLWDEAGADAEAGERKNAD
jgi:hypothetical protein